MLKRILRTHVLRFTHVLTGAAPGGLWPDIAKEIRNASTAREAFNIAQANKQYQRSDWLQVNIAMMDVALLHKFQQHVDLKIMLLATGDSELIEVTENLSLTDSSD
ncbi:hypothetical protein C0992_004938 [Termitomyces sp. T32_za158]|nr:hypothetical protein C0992_004938 [Termitomyces sp. T32_za158]